MLDNIKTPATNNQFGSLKNNHVRVIDCFRIPKEASWWVNTKTLVTVIRINNLILPVINN